MPRDPAAAPEGLVIPEVGRAARTGHHWGRGSAPPVGTRVTSGQIGVLHVSLNCSWLGLLPFLRINPEKPMQQGTQGVSWGPGGLASAWASLTSPSAIGSRLSLKGPERLGVWLLARVVARGCRGTERRWTRPTRQ